MIRDLTADTPTGRSPAPAPSETLAPASPSSVKRASRAASARVNGATVDVGDAIRIERRYVVDGALTSVEDTGRFRGVELVGSSEHLVLEQGRKRTVRMIPLHTVSEITLEKKGKPGAARRGDAFDPSFV